MRRSSLRLGICCLAVTLTTTTVARAQDEHAGHDHAPDAADAAAAAPSWHWSTDANVFFGYNYQKRLFADFSSWESQNWLMASGARATSRGAFSVNAMLSLEPLTIPKLGSPQLFQTGEAYQGVPLVNYQHPHDLIMGLGASYHVSRSRVTYLFDADLVGSPALGPVPFMHRASARDNPQVPLTHHLVDSSHISAGVLTAGARVGQFTVETSAFRGEEPDDRRYNIEKPALDSWSARLGWQRGHWQAQFSGGLLHQPESFEPYDEARLTASLAFDGQITGRPLAATFVWGENRENTGFNGTSDGYMLEWDLGVTRMSTFYGRAEVAEKQLFGLGGDPKGFGHPHTYYLVSALTAGYIREIVRNRAGRVGIGADITAYRMPSSLAEFYGSSSSYHAFLRWRPGTTAAHVH